MAAHAISHDLKHTTASLPVSAGTHVKAVRRILGHASARITLDEYADLFEDDLDAVVGALNHAASQASVGKPRAIESVGEAVLVENR